MSTAIASTVSPCCARVIAAQAAAIEVLEVELAALVAAENEYHAALVRGDIVAAKSLARLVHKHEEA